MRNAQFDLQDFLTQMGKVKKMGRLADLVKMIPGAGKISAQLGVDDMNDDFFKRTESIILSMTMEERKNPGILLKERSKASRKRRIAQGSGVTVQEVNQLLSQFDDAKKMMKTLAQNGTRAKEGSLWKKETSKRPRLWLQNWRLSRSRTAQAGMPRALL
jgi:signal recognition particle subunit SRP54